MFNLLIKEVKVNKSKKDKVIINIHPSVLYQNTKMKYMVNFSLYIHKVGQWQLAFDESGWNLSNSKQQIL